MKLKNTLLKSTAIVAISSLGMSAAFADQPASGSAMGDAVASISANVSAIRGYVEAIASSMLQPSQQLGNDLAVRQNMNVLSQTQSNITKSTSDNLSLIFQGDDTLADTVNAAFKMDTKGAGDYSGLSAYSLLGLSQSKPNSYRPFELYTTTYNPDQAQAAKEYIGFLSGSAMAMVKPEGDSIQAKQEVNMYRTLAAVQSLDAYNLSKIYASRYPALSTQAAHLSGITTPAGKVSQQGLVHYVLQQKVNNPDWYKQMQKASPFTVMREGVYMLAAGVSELYTIEQNQQQMILTQTATNTATIAMAKTLMDQMNAANRMAEQSKQ